ncbi:MAG: NADPH-dependent F420 reductase, partial [Halioglobus sp.]
MTTENLPILAILGGTGDLGTGLARRWAQAGYQVIIGSRTAEKAEAAAADLREVMAERGLAEITVQAMENLAAATAADIVTLTVPFSHQASTLELVKPVLQGKILIDVTVPLVPPKVARVQMPAQGSAGQIAQEILGEDVSVVSAFQNVAAHHLQEGKGISCDVLVSGNKKVAR